MKCGLICIALIASLLSCATPSTETRSPARIVKVCTYNFLVNWMSAGSSPSSVLHGDAKKAADALNAGRNLNGVCDENEDTVKEDF